MLGKDSCSVVLDRNLRGLSLQPLPTSCDHQEGACGWWPPRMGRECSGVLGRWSPEQATPPPQGFLCLPVHFGHIHLEMGFWPLANKTPK